MTKQEDLKIGINNMYASMYSSHPSFVLGFHGCDKSIVQEVLYDQTRLKSSNNDYDWLGHGIYFWENNPQRALEYAQTLSKNPHLGKGFIQEPAVLGAIIDLGYCLNLFESKSLMLMKQSYDLLSKSTTELPQNKSVGSDSDLLLRYLDCAVIEYLHAYNKLNGYRSYDSVKGGFIEGKELYPNAGFKEKNHIQICIINPNCIKGYFAPLKPLRGHSIP
ncbi:MAG: hypothetical protein PHP26_02370 [Syntrophomonas sp.]|uniref:hypothetical protein n=1 Tax=Syntrophomonas sp. TaxID=2053627 RepID=UPI00261B2BA9|nr:hypothetical protein [Syntrophomonas sp.]MDD2510163.1 hypothetical protein [Syntrophomonas sp.]MDD3878819.1 hypothetical protein [Syntrophomonas sp.]